MSARGRDRRGEAGAGAGPRGPQAGIGPRGREGGWAAGKWRGNGPRDRLDRFRGLLCFFLFFYFKCFLTQTFKPFQIQIFSQIFTNIFSQLFLGLFTNILRLLKPQQQNSCIST
jgi:hypothetical protein